MSFKLASLAFVLAFLFFTALTAVLTHTLTGLSLSLAHLYSSHRLMRHEKTGHGCLSGPFNTHTQSIVSLLLLNAIKILFASFSFSCLAPSNGEAVRGNQMATQTSSLSPLSPFFLLERQMALVSLP